MTGRERAPSERSNNNKNKNKNNTSIYVYTQETTKQGRAQGDAEGRRSFSSTVESKQRATKK